MKKMYRMISTVGVVIAILLQMQLPLMMAGCPLDLSGSNFTLVASICSNPNERGKCCRYINAYVALSVTRYANTTSNLGVGSDLSDDCLHYVSETLSVNGVPPNAMGFCGLGTKIPLNYECKGITTITQMLQSPGFVEVANDCQVSVSEGRWCRKCINSSIMYLRQIIGADDNTTLSTCRDATFVTLSSQSNNASAVEIARCFFGVPRLSIAGVANSSLPPSSVLSPEASPSAADAESPSQLSLSASPYEKHIHHGYHLSLIPGVAVAVTAVSLLLLLVLVFLIRRKSKELEDPEICFKTSMAPPAPPPRSVRKIHEGPSSAIREFSYKEIKKATDGFSTVIGQGGFGTVYKARLSDGMVAAVKCMDKVSEQAEDEFCREIELLARLHHRHLVSLKGFCIQKQERFLMYEYMENGSLKDQLHTPGRAPLSWQTRMQIAIDVANALEYLHFYCDPPLCHRDIKSSNILLDENFVAKVADFGLAYASKDGSICFEPINTDVRGTPGYMDPEYLITRELTEKSDVYSYGVVLLELVTGRRAIQDDRNLVQWSQTHLTSNSKVSELVDQNLGDTFDYDQLHTIVALIKWCTQPESRARPSIKQVLRLLYESSDPLHIGFARAVEYDEEYEANQGRRRMSKAKMQRNDGEGRFLASSSSTNRSYCSRSFLLENGGSPQSPPNIPSI